MLEARGHGIIVVTFLHAHLGQFVRMMVQNSPLNDAHLGKQFRIVFEKLKSLTIGQFVDGKGLSRTDFVSLEPPHQNPRQSRSSPTPSRIFSLPPQKVSRTGTTLSQRRVHVASRPRKLSSKGFQVA